MTSTPWRSLSLGSVTTFVAAWNGLALLVLFGPLVTQLRVSAAFVVWIAAAFDAAAAAAVGAGAAWTRRVGSRAALASGSAAFAAASAGCALAQGPLLLVFARAAQGAAAAVAVTAAFEGMAGGGDPAMFGIGRGFRTGGLGAALACGPLLAGAVAAARDWRWVFWTDAALGAALACGAVAMRRDRGRAASEEGVADLAPAYQDPFEALGLVLVAAAVAGPVGALAEAAAVGWGNIRTLVPLAAGVAALVPVLAWRTPLGALYGRTFVAAQTADLCLFASISGMLFLLTQYFHAVLGAGPLGVGLRMAPWSAAVAVVLAASSAAEVGARGMRTLIAAGLTLDSVGLLGLAAAVRHRQTGGWLVVSLVLSGVGVGLALPAARRAAVTVAGLGLPEGVVGGLGAVRWAGGGLGIALFGAVFVARGGYGSATSVVHGVFPAVGAAALVAAAGAAAAWTLPARDRPPVVPMVSRPDGGGVGRRRW